MADKVYKLVKRVTEGDKSTLVSTMVIGDASVVYIPGKWETAPDWLSKINYHLFAFSLTISALILSQNTKDYNKGFELWEAEAEGLVDSNLLRISSTKSGGYNLNKDNIKKQAVNLWKPHNTVVYKRIKLIKKI